MPDGSFVEQHRNRMSQDARDFHIVMEGGA